MTSYARKKVSKKKRRFEQDGFDLDLAYITPRIIAMGFPSVGKEALYRNPLPEVYRFFETKHKDNYKLYNLCAEREYDITKFHSRVSRYPFYDHNAPKLQLIADCCADISKWLAEDENHIVGINCKAGKGRTGLIICCYLLYSGACTDTADALQFYGNKRTKDGKGVTIASQQRYIRYYEHCLKNLKGLVPKTPVVQLEKLTIKNLIIPKMWSGAHHVEIEIDNVVRFKSKSTTPKKGDEYEIVVGAEIQGDCKIQLWVKTDRLCHFWINTGFFDSESKLEKGFIDVANKDKDCTVFKKDFSITPHFTLVKKASEDDEKPDDKPIIIEKVIIEKQIIIEKVDKKSGSGSADDKEANKKKSPSRSDSKGRGDSGLNRSSKVAAASKGRGSRNNLASSDGGKGDRSVTKKPKRDPGDNGKSDGGDSRRKGAKKLTESEAISTPEKSPKPKKAKTPTSATPPEIVTQLEPPTHKSKSKSSSSSRDDTQKKPDTLPIPSSDSTGSIPSTETQPKKDTPPASLPTSDSAGQTTDLPTVVEPVVSPRTGRDHARSFYKYSDYKEVIEKMKLGADPSTVSSESSSDYTSSSSLSSEHN